MTKRPKMANDLSAIDLLTPARLTRETVDPFVPMILFAPRRGQAYTAVLDGEFELEALIEEACKQMRASLGPALWIAVTTDAYVKFSDEPESVQTGELHRAFLEGDLEVGEQMMVYLKSRTLGEQIAVQRYRHTPVDGWEWSDPELIHPNNDDTILPILGRYM